MDSRLIRTIRYNKRTVLFHMETIIFIDMFAPKWARGPHNLARFPPGTLALPLGIERGI